MAKNKNKVQTALEYAVARTLIGALRILPRASSERLARGVAHLLDRSVPKLRKVGLCNLSFAYPHWTEEQRNRTLDGVFHSIARMLVALAKMPDLNVDNVHEWVGYEGLEHYLAAKEKRRGVLVATGHLGNWELSAYTHALMTEPMNVMVRPLDNPSIDELIEKRRSFSGNRLIFKKDAARTVLKALKNNEAVGILIDQNTALSEGGFIDFFGKPACANTAFVKLAYHSGAPVVPGFAFWEGRRYVLRFYPALELTGDVLTDTQCIHSRLEEIIREYPDQWMWIHRRWKTRPAGEPTLY